MVVVMVLVGTVTHEAGTPPAVSPEIQQVKAVLQSLRVGAKSLFYLQNLER